MMTSDPFVCSSCFGAPAESVRYSQWQTIACLVDKSHFIVVLLACPACDQRWLSVFTEAVDWENGDDAQYWSLFPVTDSEVNELIPWRDEDGDSRIEELGRNRRYLQVDYPTGKPKTVRWANGNLRIGPWP